MKSNYRFRAWLTDQDESSMSTAREVVIEAETMIGATSELEKTFGDNLDDFDLIDTRPVLDDFTRAYIEAALWSTNDEADESGGEPLDDNYDTDDIAPETLTQMAADCERFQKIASSMLTDDDCTYGGCSAIKMAGHDFWLTRNGHGAGFWDGDWPEHGDALTELCAMFGEQDLYVGDDGRIW